MSMSFVSISPSSPISEAVDVINSNFAQISEFQYDTSAILSNYREEISMILSSVEDKAIYRYNNVISAVSDIQTTVNGLPTVSTITSMIGEQLKDQITYIEEQAISKASKEVTERMSNYAKRESAISIAEQMFYKDDEGYLVTKFPNQDDDEEEEEEEGGQDPEEDEETTEPEEGGQNPEDEEEETPVQKYRSIVDYYNDQQEVIDGSYTGGLGNPDIVQRLIVKCLTTFETIPDFFTIKDNKPAPRVVKSILDVVNDDTNNFKINAGRVNINGSNKLEVYSGASPVMSIGGDVNTPLNAKDVTTIASDGKFTSSSAEITGGSIGSTISITATSGISVGNFFTIGSTMTTPLIAGDGGVTTISSNGKFTSSSVEITGGLLSGSSVTLSGVKISNTEINNGNTTIASGGRITSTDASMSINGGSIGKTITITVESGISVNGLSIGYDSDCPLTAGSGDRFTTIASTGKFASSDVEITGGTITDVDILSEDGDTGVHTAIDDGRLESNAADISGGSIGSNITITSESGIAVGDSFTIGSTTETPLNAGNGVTTISSDGKFVSSDVDIAGTVNVLSGLIADVIDVVTAEGIRIVDPETRDVTEPELDEFSDELWNRNISEYRCDVCLSGLVFYHYGAQEQCGTDPDTGEPNNEWEVTSNVSYDYKTTIDLSTGKFTSKNAYLTGGSIGSTISITAASGIAVNGLSIGFDSSKPLTINNNTTYISSNGKFVSSNVDISGKITSASGILGSTISITGTGITVGNLSIGYDINTPLDANDGVTTIASTGKFTSSSVEITGGSISNVSLLTGTLGSTISITGTGISVGNLSIGHDANTPLNANDVTTIASTGKFTSSDVEITGGSISNVDFSNSGNDYSTSILSNGQLITSGAEVTGIINAVSGWIGNEDIAIEDSKGITVGLLGAIDIDVPEDYDDTDDLWKRTISQYRYDISPVGLSFYKHSEQQQRAYADDPWETVSGNTFDDIITSISLDGGKFTSKNAEISNLKVADLNVTRYYIEPTLVNFNTSNSFSIECSDDQNYFIENSDNNTAVTFILPNNPVAGQSYNIYNCAYDEGGHGYQTPYVIKVQAQQSDILIYCGQQTSYVLMDDPFTVTYSNIPAVVHVIYNGVYWVTYGIYNPNQTQQNS